MFAIKYNYGEGSSDFKIFETVGAAMVWWACYLKASGKLFQDVLFVIPPGQKNPLEWCYNNIR